MRRAAGRASPSSTGSPAAAPERSDSRSSSGRAGVYDLRVSTQPITAANFDAAQEVEYEPWPEEAGSVQEMKVGGLAASQTYYFALKTMDEYELPQSTSGISNTVSLTTLPPPTVAVVPTSIQQTVDKGTGASETITVSNDHTESISNNKTLSVGVDHTESIGSNKVHVN